ncbi:TRF-like 5 [Hibiscus trionum]|uniref:TRF-like 5 n=1 Tax=Hibiscus trionum TaxID=183268 RepID=A0A9W7MGP5_HIBTR|nr:TRF-like 5 [Hibiscus trionum]
MERELDPDICSSIIEFLVRKSADEMLLKQLVAAFPPLNPTPRLKKAVLLRSIQREIIAGEVPEKLLDSLEMIERIDTNQTLPISDSMRKAYCDVALECTVKYLSGNPNPKGLYSDAVNRIWRGRIENLEKSKASDLVSERLRNLGRQVEAALGDEVVVRRLIATNTRNDALVSLRLYLHEALASLGPPLIERACSELTVGES